MVCSHLDASVNLSFGPYLPVQQYFREQSEILHHHSGFSIQMKLAIFSNRQDRPATAAVQQRLSHKMHTDICKIKIQ